MPASMDGPTQDSPNQPEGEVPRTFWTPVQDAVAEGGKPWRRYAKWIGTGLVALIVISWAVQFIAGTTRAPATKALNLPPVGSIWFVSSFDEGTFVIQGEPFTTGFSDTASRAGRFSYQITDIDGNILASGSIVAH